MEHEPKNELITEGKVKRFRRHMSANIEGLLRNYKGKKINFIEDDNGRVLSDKEARIELAKLQALGHKLIGNCEGFDPFGGGCPGHEITESDGSN